MSSIADDPTRYLATTALLLDRALQHEAARLVRAASARVEATGYDNWNGGTTTWTIYMQVEPSLYPTEAANREALEELIAERFQEVVRADSRDWFTVALIPATSADAAGQQGVNGVSRATRKAIFDTLKLQHTPWSGELDEVEFLDRLYDLKTLPSYDRRFSNAAGDIRQHRVNNPDDWSDDWVFGDGRFGLMDGPAQAFLAFLVEMVHPVVRPSPDEAAQLVDELNEHLRNDGWCLVVTDRKGGHTIYTARRTTFGEDRAIAGARAAAETLNAEWMRKEVERMEAAIESDPALAIGTAKDLVESCCKSILKARGVAVSGSEDLPKLTKLLASELELVPDDIPEQAKGAQAIRLILQNLASLTKYLAELRGLYGSGHGRDGKHRGLQPRHARLAVGAAVTFVEFVTETYQWRNQRGQ